MYEIMVQNNDAGRAYIHLYKLIIIKKLFSFFKVKLPVHGRR